MNTAHSRLVKRQSGVWALLVFILAVCCCGYSARAQEVTATINGTVTDTADRVVPNADVKATDLDRGTVWPARTNEAGFYSLSHLPVGRYEVRVKVTGFVVAVESPIELQLNQVAAVNIRLVVGSESQTVQVTTAAPLLQTDTTDVGTVIDARTNVGLPLASRNYLQLTLLTPGAVTVQPTGFESGQNVGQVARPEINGNRFDANSYLLDGMDNNDAGSNYVAYSPQPDAIQEFRVITQNAPADFGNYMGGVISASIKAGTNSFHGTAFEFFRNDVLNANQWENKLIPGDITPRQKMRWNEFGGTVGGPIWKDKLFFFADYQGERFDFPRTTSFITVFTADERTGNVSELVAAGKTIVDPLTGQPFPNNTIPQNRLSPAALAILNSSYYPKPINSLLQSNATNTTAVATVPTRAMAASITPLNEKDHFMGRFSDAYLTNPTINSFGLDYNPFNLVSDVELRYRLYADDIVKPRERRASGRELRRCWTEPHHLKLFRKRRNLVHNSWSDYRFPARYEFQRGIREWFRHQGKRHRQLRHLGSIFGRFELGAWEAQYALRLPGLADSHQWIVQRQQWAGRKLQLRLLLFGQP